MATNWTQVERARTDARTDARAATPTLERVKTLLEDDKLHEAVNLLEVSDDTSVAALALLGAAYFRLEEYGKAVHVLRKAESRAARAPLDESLRALLDRALANEHTDIRRHVPEPIYFDEQKPRTEPEPGAHPNLPPTAALPKSTLARAFAAIGTFGGVKLGETLHVLTQLLGREPSSASKWTTWYTHDLLRATLMLARRRERLNNEQLFAAYPKSTGTAFFKSKGPLPAWAKTARTPDGSWNALEEPMAGAAGTRFGFNTDPTKTPAEPLARMLTPNPRLVSRELLTRKDGFKAIPFLNLTAASWIQFMNHDWVSYGDPDVNAEPYRIPLAEEDPARRVLHQTHMLVRPTQQDPSRRSGESTPTHVNEVTSWWDASQIYGSDAKTVEALRSHKSGKLTVDPKTGNLPVLADGVEHTGFRRNWWVGLSMLHTLFVKEHNAICDMLAARYPKLDDQRLFDTARLINAAQLAKIHTVEWTPAVLPNAALNAAMNANWYGFLTNVLRPKKTRKTLAEINIADPVAGGLVGNVTDNHGVPYSLSREFVSVYRLHSLLPDTIAVYSVGGGDEPNKTFSLAELRQAAAHRVTGQFAMHDLFYSFGRQSAGQLVLNNYPTTLQNLSIPGAGFYDLAAVDVLRDRERGTPRYNQFRRLFGLKPLNGFEELSDDPNAIRALRNVYASIEDVDLLVGNLAETHRPKGFGFGETLFEVFILNASRRLQADRFFTDAYREEVYTAEGLSWIDDASLRTVLLRHYPQLGATGLVNLENAFEPWDVGELDPKRHPLREFDPELRQADERLRLRNRLLADGANTTSARNPTSAP